MNREARAVEDTDTACSLHYDVNKCPCRAYLKVLETAHQYALVHVQIRLPCIIIRQICRERTKVSYHMKTGF